MLRGGMVIPFLIIIGGRGAGGAYGLRAQAAGRSAEAALELPGAAGGPEADGAALGRAVFVPAVRQLLLDVARGADEAGARIQIQLRVAPDLAGLPWEWLSLGSQTLWQPALREDYTLVRVAQAVRPPAALPAALPLRLLIAAAPGCGAAADALGAALAGEVRARRLIVDRLRDADPAGLAEALDEEPCHLLHLVAPATPGLAGGPARAALPRLRLGRSIDPPAMARLIAEHPDLRMVTLAGDGLESAGPLAELAAALHESSGLATAALGTLDDAAAADFCAVCYSALAAGEPADLAVTYGREDLAAAGGPWGAPQFFMAPGGEALFRIGAEAPAARPERRPTRPERRPTRPERRPTRDDEATQPVRPIARPQPRPALASRGEGAARPSWLTPRLIALLVAGVILALMVSRVIRRPEGVAPTLTPTSAPMAPTVPTPLGGGQAGGQTADGAGQLEVAHNALLAGLAPTSPAAVGNPIDAAPPLRFVTYLAAEGDSVESLAQRAGSDPRAILALNRMAAGEALRPGRPLALPVYSAAEALPQAPIIARGSPARPEVALTFDIEIDDSSLYSILDILEARGLRGTFFLTGRWAKAYPDAARRIVADGHEIGNHSLTHPFFTKIGMDGVAPELDKTEQIVREVTGASTRPYFRFPYGASSQAAIDIVAADGFVPYHWSADEAAIPGWLDRAAASPAQVYGDILLMHQRPETVQALPGWLDRLAALGLRPVPLGEAMR